MSPALAGGFLPLDYQVKSWSSKSFDLLLLIYFLISFNLTQFLLSAKIVSIWVISHIPERTAY